MAARKQFVKTAESDPELRQLVLATADSEVTEEDLREQRISFAYGNAPVNAERITKDSVRRASGHIRLQP